MGSQRAERGEADGRTREAEARRPRGSLATRFRRHLARPVDAASLGAFRFWFGLCIAIEVLRFFAHGWIRRYYIDPVFTFTLPGFGFLRPWPGGGMYLHFAVLGLAGLAVMLGFCYRLAIAVLFLAFTYVFALEEAHYQNHFYLIALLGFLLLWMPADRWGALRLSALRRSRATAAEPAGAFAVTATVPNWTVFLLRAQLFIVYFYAGIAKLDSDWLQGQPMAMWLARSGDVPLLGPLLTRPGMVPVFAYGGLLYDLSVPFLLVWPRTRAFGLIWTCCFHLLNAMLFQIGIFPWLAMGATLIFAAPDWPRRALRVARGWIRHRPASAVAEAPGPAATVAPSPSRPPAASPARLASWGTTALVSAYLTVHLLVPLRHWLYPGDVAWTEEGHIAELAHEAPRQGGRDPRLRHHRSADRKADPPPPAPGPDRTAVREDGDPPADAPPLRPLARGSPSPGPRGTPANPRRRVGLPERPPLPAAHRPPRRPRHGAAQPAPEPVDRAAPDAALRPRGLRAR